MSFVHLHLHTGYSLLDGMCKIEDVIERAIEYKTPAVAVTDHGSLYGAFKFYTKALDAGIKPIIGVEVYMAKKSRFDKQPGIERDQYHLTLLAKNENGYRNLMKLVTIAHLEGYYYKPRIDFELLTQYHEDLICTSACVQGQVASLLREGKTKQAEEVAKTYSELFGPDHYYIEIQKHPHLPFIDEVNEKLIALSRKLGLPLVATNDIHYVDPEDAEAQEILLCVQTQHTIVEKNRPLSMLESPDFYMRSPDEMKELFIQYPEAIENTKRIADMCDISLSVGKW